MLRLILLTSAVLWLALVGVGLRVLWAYENSPGESANPPVLWPTESRIQREQNRATLVMLVHPHCPCTRATMNELAGIMAHAQGRLTAYVLFLKPEGFSEDWEKTDLWQTAASIPGVHVMVDERGAEARLFNSSTSGQTILYDATGLLLFSGGITGSRGHSGDNAGRSAIVSLVNEGTADRAETSVFGCPLFDQKSECLESEHGSNKH
ncbi:MAG: RedB protein [Pyrinomonadaceae bacterium]|nr:RedB protein [Pyrinomonadaceae bacterium]